MRRASEPVGAEATKYRKPDASGTDDASSQNNIALSNVNMELSVVMSSAWTA